MSNCPTTQKECRLAVTLRRELFSGNWYVDHIEIRHGSVRNNLRFSRDVQIEEAFSETFVAQLADRLPVSLDQQVLSISGVAVALDSVVLTGMRVLTQSVMDGVQNVIIRFNRVLGRVFDILAPIHRPETPVPTDLSALSFSETPRITAENPLIRDRKPRDS